MIGDRPTRVGQRVVVALTESSSGETLIRRAAAMAQGGDVLGVHVRPAHGPTAGSSEFLEHHRGVLNEVGGSLHIVVADDVPSALVSFAHGEHATQLVLGVTRRSRWGELLRGSVVNDVARRADPIDVHVISTGDQARDPGLQGPIRHHSVLSRRRRAVGWVVTAAGIPALTVLFANTRGVLGNEARALLYLMLVLVAAATGGMGPALATSVLAALMLNWFFTPPLYTWDVADVENGVALVVFVLAGVGVSFLVTQVARRSHEAARARADAEALARAAGGLVADHEPFPAILDGLRMTLDLDGVSLFVAEEGAWRPAASAGRRPPESPGKASMTFELPDGYLLALGGPLGEGEGRVLRAFTAQLVGAIDRRRLRDEAARAEAIGQADALRTALLRAVSHDLRTPLASIKASVTSLLDGDVAWSATETKEFLTAVDEETDRLNRLVGNLLDMSRLQVGAVRPDLRLVAVDDVVSAALASISGLNAPIAVDVPDDLRLVRADPALLERALANIVANAVAASSGATVGIEARAVWSDVVIEVVDHGPGVPPDARERIFEPFQRLDDRGGGVGLGLAVARGLVEVMGGTIAAEETPGGGLTLAITLQGAPGRG